MFRRLLGLIMLFIGLSGIALSVAGVMVAGDVVDAVVLGLDDTLALTNDSLDTVEDTLVLVKATVADVNAGLDTVEATAVDVSRTLDDTRPLLEEIGAVASEDVPNSIEAVQDTIPNVAEVAKAVDDTLGTLNDFAIDETILGFEIQYDLGIDYEPDVPFDQSVEAIGGSIGDLPDRLRGMQTFVDVSSHNLDTISQDILLISTDLNTINGRIAEVSPLMDDYIRIVNEVNDQTGQIRTSVDGQLDTIKLAVNIILIWLGLTQLAPLVLGWEFLTGWREKQEVVAVVEDDEDKAFYS